MCVCVCVYVCVCLCVSVLLCTYSMCVCTPCVSKHACMRCARASLHVRARTHKARACISMRKGSTKTCALLLRPTPHGSASTHAFYPRQDPEEKHRHHHPGLWQRKQLHLTLVSAQLLSQAGQDLSDICSTDVATARSVLRDQCCLQFLLAILHLGVIVQDVQEGGKVQLLVVCKRTHTDTDSVGMCRHAQCLGVQTHTVLGCVDTKTVLGMCRHTQCLGVQTHAVLGCVVTQTVLGCADTCSVWVCRHTQCWGV